MSNDIKIVDYIPEDRKLCNMCEFYEICPVNYICPSLGRLIDYEAEHGEL